MKSMKQMAVMMSMLMVAMLCLGMAMRQAQRGEPTVVVTVNLPRVVNALEQRAAAETNLQAMLERKQQEERDRAEAITSMEQRLLEMPEGSPERKSLVESVALKRLELAGWQKFSEEQIDIERSLVLRNIERAIKSEIESMCRSEGYDLCLIDDSSKELQVNPRMALSREAQVMQQMSNRRMMYASDQLDITDDLIARMNNAFVAGG